MKKNSIWLFIALLILAGCNLSADDATPTPETIPDSVPTETESAELPPPATFQVTNTSLPILPPVQVTVIPDTRPTSTPLPTSNVQPFPVYGTGVTASPEATISADATLPASPRDRYEAQVSAGVTLIVDYTVTLNRTGQAVVIWVVDPSGTVLGSKTITQTETSTLEVQTQVGGRHEILVYFERLDGGYQVSFRTR